MFEFLGVISSPTASYLPAVQVLDRVFSEDEVDEAGRLERGDEGWFGKPLQVVLVRPQSLSRAQGAHEG